jgi:hypothetical protein
MMRSVLCAIAFAIAATIPTHADPPPDAAAFLREIGIDPASADVASVIKDVVSNDKVKDISLNSLATKRDKDGVKRFIATRVFFHKFVVDSNTRAPPDELYRTLYLTNAEKGFIACQISKNFGMHPGAC